jgi:4'-phosphopantetheinyl transferase
MTICGEKGVITRRETLWLVDFSCYQCYADLGKRAAHQKAPAEMKRDPTWDIPPLHLQLQEQEVHVWQASLVVHESTFQDLQGVLVKEEVARAARYHFEKDRYPWIVARGILRILLGRYLNTAPDQLQFSSNDYGKPFLTFPTPSHRLQFNVSHSQDLALYAFAYDRQVGIDVEYKRAGLNYEALAKVSFSTDEQARLHSLPFEFKQDAFFNCWTRKEAYIKARGKGFSIPTDQFDVSFLPGEPAVLLQNREDPREITRWSLKELAPGIGYAGALAVEGVGWRLCCWEWKE